MVAYSFKKRFAAPILAGTKTQTIRAPRKRHARVGEELQLYTGMRTKQCELITTARCIDVAYVGIDFRKGREGIDIGDTATVVEYCHSPESRDTFAQADGFTDFSDMHAFWLAEHGEIERFEGVLIRWAPL